MEKPRSVSIYQPLSARALTEEEKTELTAAAQSGSSQDSRRAEVILLSAAGKPPSEIAKSIGYHPSNVKKWIKKFNEEGLSGIAVRKRGPREGPKPRFTREQVEKLLQLAQTEPEDLGFPFERWTAQKLASAAVHQGIVQSISHVTVQQILKRSQARKSAAAEQPGRVEDMIAAGRKALSVSEFERATELFRNALDSGPHSDEAGAEIRVLLSQALEELSRFDEVYSVVSMYEDPHSLVQLSPHMRGWVKLRVGWAHGWLGNHPKAIAYFNDAKKIFLDLQDDLGVSEARYALGRTYTQIGEPGIARDHLVAVLESAPAEPEPGFMAKVYLRLGTVDFQEGAFWRSRENYLKAYEFASSSGNTNLIGQALLNLGVSFDVADPSDRAAGADYGRRAIECLERTAHKDLPLALNNLADNLLHSGLWDDAVECSRKAVEIARHLKQSTHEAMAHISLAEILCARGSYQQAEEHVRQAMELIEGTGDKWLETYALKVLATIYRGMGRIEGALNLLRQSLRLFTSVGDMSFVTLVQISLAETHFAQGGYDQGREYVELAQARLKEEKSKPLFASGLIQRVIAQIELASGSTAVARQHAAQSVSIFTTCAIPYELARSQIIMARVLVAADEQSAAKANLEKAVIALDSLAAEPDKRSAIRQLEDLDAHTRTGASEFEQRFVGRKPRAREIETDDIFTDRSEDAGRAGYSVSQSSAAGDLLLMQRLIEASASRELLLREMVSVFVESFPVKGALVGKIADDGGVEAIAHQGIPAQDLDSICSRIERGLTAGPGEMNGDYLHRFTVAAEETAPQKSHLAGLVLWASTEEGRRLDLSRVEPLLKQVELGLEACALRAAIRSAQPAAKLEQRPHTVLPGFIIGSPLMFDVIERIHKIRTSDVTVLITGDSGTGKELVARAVHAESARARAIFLPFNCTATPRDLIESQLFGHRRGAFTGATTNYAGMIKAAEGGTLFLDEIGDLALEVQPKLMRFLQEGEIQPLGETRPIKVDVRVIAATNSDLERAVEEGRFREDLFHRLNIIRIHVPPLRERREEIPALVTFFMDHFAARSGKRGVTLMQESVEALAAYDWPGNVRQLRNEIERLMAYASDAGRISTDDLSPEIMNPARGLRAKSAQAATTDYQPRRVERQPDDTLRRIAPPLPPPVNGNGHSQDSLRPLKFKDAIAELETRLITEALTRNNNNLSRTAIELGLSRRGLRLKLAQLGIERGNSL